MAEKNTRWENDKEWAGWTLRDEIYTSVRKNIGPYIVSGVGGLAVAAYAYAKSYPMLAAVIGTAIGTMVTIVGSAAFSRRKKLNTAQVGSVQSRAWSSLSREQIATLRNRLAAMPATLEQHDNRQISIVREEFPDCADLADDIAEGFKSAGWSVIDGGPNKIFARLPDGICVAGPVADPRRAPLLAAISEVLGSAYEPIRVDTKYSMMPAQIPTLGPEGKLVIRICIGRKPRPSR